MAERVILHIGSMKSGTSFIQNVLGSNRDGLAEHGISFAGEKWRDQVVAVQDLINHGGEGQPPLDPAGPWQRLVDGINATPGTSVVSMEFLAPRTPLKVRMIRDALHGRVDVVLTGRDLARNVVAMWQEAVQNGSSVTWDGYLQAVRAEDDADPVSRGFWRHQALADIAARWSGEMGADRFTLLTVPPRGAAPELLWERFAQVLGIPADAFELDVRANPSIGLATAMTLRHLNELLDDTTLTLETQGSMRHYDLLVKHLLTKRGLVARGAREPRLGLDEKWVMKRGAQEVDRLRRQGHRVIGDLDDLVPRPVPGVHPSQVSLADQHEAAMDALARMVTVAATREARFRRKLARVRLRLRQVRKAAR